MNIKNRGSLSNPEGRFEKQIHAKEYDGWDLEEEVPNSIETTLIPENAKKIISTNDSPDIGFEQSINPYQGCEHGCIYCYARPSHAYKNLSPGIDFETKIFYKADAAKLLEKEITKPKYICKPIMLGANTDPYQPAENKLKITRSILETLEKYNHPVMIITKNTLIQRDIDILKRMAERQLVKIAVSITTLSVSLKQKMEPRTSTPKGRLNIVRCFASENIPVRVMAAPMIPMINDMELEKILELSRESGALYASYVLIRLPHEVKHLFKEWLAKHFPDRAGHVMSLIRQMRGGKEYDSTFGQRMQGMGQFAELLAVRFKLACKKFGLNGQLSPALRVDLFQPQPKQLDLFS